MSSYLGHEFEGGQCIHCGAIERNVRQFQLECTEAPEPGVPRQSAPANETPNVIAHEMEAPKTFRQVSAPTGSRSAGVGRYRDAYVVADSIVRNGNMIKTAGIVLALVVALAGLIGGIHEESALVVVGGLLLGAVLMLPFYALGLMLCAQGQMLLATLDTAIASSPFLSKNEMREAMNLKPASDG